jgi:hypothetical protein
MGWMGWMGRMGRMGMTDLRERLRDADPLAHEGAMSAEHADAIRRVVVAAGRRTRHEATFWPRPLWVAATVALTLSAGIIAGRRLSVPESNVHPGPTDTRSTIASSPTAGERRQVQFATPGGTRIIWVLNAEFNP